MTPDKPMTVSDEQPSSDKLVERLQRTRQTVLVGGMKIDSLVNPDGPEAANAITTLQSKAEQQLKELDDLWREKHATLQSERDRMLRERDTYKTRLMDAQSRLDRVTEALRRIANLRKHSRQDDGYNACWMEDEAERALAQDTQP
jgi:chromosome segregation ATPase